MIFVWIFPCLHRKSRRNALYLLHILKKECMRKIRYIGAVACLSLAVACHQPSEKENSDNELTVNGGKKEFLMLVGNYAEPTEEGIKLYCFNEENGQAT